MIEKRAITLNKSDNLELSFWYVFHTYQSLQTIIFIQTIFLKFPDTKIPSNNIQYFAGYLFLELQIHITNWFQQHTVND